ncbi:MAG: oligopeptide/dipeptide ABC transporter ATP-binding protein [Pseudonocardiaceae bacterium]
MLELSAAAKEFVSGPPWSRRRTPALHGVDLTVEVGHTLGILGESGSGKTTLLRLAAFILRPSAGRVRVAGVDPWALRPAARRQLRRRVQLVLQSSSDPLDPLQRAVDAVAEPLANFGVPARQGRELAAAALVSVGLTPDLAGRYPSQLSGGQRQRVNLARALVLDPDVVLLDEPVSALDPSSAAQVLDLLAHPDGARRPGYVLVSHEAEVIRALAEHVLVLYAGRVVERGPVGAVLDTPAHPYAASLRAAQLTLRPGAGLPEVAAPAPAALAGCPFSPRCVRATAGCRVTEPPPTTLTGGHVVRCFHPVEQCAPQAADGRPYGGS